MHINSDEDIKIVHMLARYLQCNIIIEINEKNYAQGELKNVDSNGVAVIFTLIDNEKESKVSLPLPYDISYVEKEEIIVMDYTNKTMTNNDTKLMALMEACASDYNNSIMYDNYVYIMEEKN